MLQRNSREAETPRRRELAVACCRTVPRHQHSAGSIRLGGRHRTHCNESDGEAAGNLPDAAIIGIYGNRARTLPTPPPPSVFSSSLCGGKRCWGGRRRSWGGGGGWCRLARGGERVGAGASGRTKWHFDCMFPGGRNNARVKWNRAVEDV